MFDEIEGALLKSATVAEVRVLARTMTALLHQHGESEQNLAYTALDHMLKEKGQINRLYTEHREMDTRFEHTQAANDFLEASRLLRSAMAMSRDHFRYEEQTLFPLINDILQDESLEKLGDAWKQRHASLRQD
ncbi:MAG: hemerythrin domain-containing protein [Verrucomicrobia bacterium]|nr:hemerythrin domain-containing protein [Verrucomicrobiota bacterium]